MSVPISVKRKVIVMSIGAPPGEAVPAVRRWTRDEYYQMGDLGWFEDQRTQLVDGEILVVSPQKWGHASTIDRVWRLLEQALDDSVWVRIQLPLTLSPYSEPEPDVSVVAGSRDDYSDHPTTALLVVEVSNTTLAFDRSRKARLYAAAGIPEYWIVNLQDRRLEVYRDPQAGKESQSESIYASISSLGEDESVAPIARTEVSILVQDLLP